MALSKTRKVGKILNTNNKLDVIDSDRINTTVNKGSNVRSTISVLSTTDQLPGSTTQGSLAYVTGNNRLYFYNGSGWYNIALINTFNPQWITQPDGSYALAIDGSSTTITVLASDSDDVPIVYTAVTDSDFDSFATVAHDSDKHNVWTITPTATIGSHSGSITFKASDGVNFVQAVSSFSLAFAVTNSSNTYALIQADDTQTDAQVDASTDAHTITEVGNVTSTAFTPYQPGGYSTYFDGSGDNIRLNANHSSINFDGDFSLEGWFYFDSLSSHRLLFDTYASGVSGSWQFYWRSTGTSLAWYDTSSGTVLLQDSNASRIQTKVWHHIAVTRKSGTLRIFVDGTLAASTTGYNTDLTHNRPLNLGSQYTTSTNYFEGYMNNIRVVKGSAIYDSDFSVPTNKLTAVPGTSLLTCHLPYIADGSSNKHSIVVTGNVSTVRVGPFNYFSYTRSDHGGSVYFDGAGDYMSVAYSANHTFGNGQFTVECWVYMTAYESTGFNTFLMKTDGTNVDWQLDYKDTSTQLRFIPYVSGTPDTSSGVVTTTLSLNQWYHVAVSRDSSNNLRMFLNGKLLKTATYSSTIDADADATLDVGTRDTNGTHDRLFTGYMSDLRVVKGSAIYDSDFTPPTSTLSNVTNTKLLTCTNKNNIWDAAAGARILKSSQVDSSTTKRKWSTVDSVYHAGSNDQYGFIMPSTLADDFTIESWFEHDAWSDTYNGFFYFSGGYYLSGFGSGSSLRLKIWNTGYDHTIQQNAEMDVLRDSGWWHFALCRTGGSSYKAFVNGTQVATFTQSGGTTNRIQVGRGGGSTKEFLGYSQDFRVTNGLARYDSDFSVPTAQFEG